jgi:hypothetical protein
MPPLEPPETHYLSAAIGWLGLGNALEAELELARIGPARQRHPDVLEVRWLICAEQNRWTEGLQLARWLIHAAPERPTGWLHQAYALRRVPGGGVQNAWDALVPTHERFPKEPIIPYNLACYACQMGRLEVARRWLRLAFALGGKKQTKTMALADSDLEALWNEIREH